MIRDSLLKLDIARVIDAWQVANDQAIVGVYLQFDDDVWVQWDGEKFNKCPELVPKGSANGLTQNPPKVGT